MRSESALAGPAGTACGEQRAAEREVVCRRAESAAEAADHRAIRHRVFVVEQGLFAGSDLDAHDQNGSAIALLGYSGGIVAGTVRLFPLDAGTGLWQGDRLAVLEPYRRLGLGAPLVRCAVATAASLGGRRMLAHIQPGNVRFFQRLGWAVEGGSELYVGSPHQPMSIGLPSPGEGRAAVCALEAGVSAPGR